MVAQDREILPLALTGGGGARITRRVKLWRSGLVWSALNFIGGLVNFACSSILGHHLAPYPGEFGYCNTLLYFTTFLGLPLQMLNTSVIHYIAYFRSRNDEARLQGLLAGCQAAALGHGGGVASGRGAGRAAGSLLPLSQGQPDVGGADVRAGGLVVRALGWRFARGWPGSNGWR